MKFDALFFDFDGVLVDSVEVKTQAFAELFKHYGKNVVDRVIEYHRCNGGMSRVQKFHYYYREILHQSLELNELTNLCDQFSAIVVDKVVIAPEIHGVESFLQKWSAKIPCFVVSATPEKELCEIVKRRGWEKYFKVVKGAPENKSSILMNLLNKYCFIPDSCMFFGDAYADYNASVVCGVKFMGIVSTPDAPLLKAVPEINFIPDFTALMKDEL